MKIIILTSILSIEFFTVRLFLFPLTEITKAVIIGDSITKDLAALKNVEVHTVRGATPENIQTYLQGNLVNLLSQYQVDVLIIHVGTNYLGTKGEWNLYRNHKKGKMSDTSFKESIALMNPLPANGTAIHFREIFQSIINTIRSVNQNITILISAIIPRPWDFERRNDIRMIYNKLLQNFNSQSDVFYIPTYRPFLDKSKSPIEDYFMPDGLHLSKKGTEQLKSFFQDKIDKACRNVLK